MASATETTPLPTAGPPPAGGGEARVLLRDVGWEGYQDLIERSGDGGRRMSYLDGSVEQMTIGPRHEGYKRILARMIDYIIMELGIATWPLGSTTFQRASNRRGVEPDDCYYLASMDGLAEYLAGPTRDSEDAPVDLDLAPPPDLVVEVELSSPLLDKLAIYAGLGVPELWRYDGRRFRILLLQPDGSYAESSVSRAFPFLPVAGFGQHLAAYDPRQEITWVRAYRDWVREVVAPLYQP